MDRNTTRSGTPPIPNTDEPRQPAERPTPVTPPQPTVPPAAPTAPSADQVNVSEATADTQQAEDDRANRIQRSGGGADNFVQSDTTDAGQPTE